MNFSMNVSLETVEDYLKFLSYHISNIRSNSAERAFLFKHHCDCCETHGEVHAVFDDQRLISVQVRESNSADENLLVIDTFNFDDGKFIYHACEEVVDIDHPFSLERMENMLKRVLDSDEIFGGTPQ